MTVGVRRSSLIESIDIKHGPPELLARFFFKAEEEAASLGVQFEIGRVEELIQINREHRDTWPPLTPTFRHGMGGITNENAIAILGRDRSGKIIAAYSVRLFDWSATNFTAEAESLRLFYADPDKDKRDEEGCIVASPEGRELTGNCMYTGALWIHPDFRGTALSTILPWTSRAVGCASWPIDNSFALIGDYGLAKKLDWKVGYTADYVYRGIRLINHITLPGKTVDFALCVIPRDYLMDGLFRFVTEFGVEDLAAVNNRSA